MRLSVEKMSSSGVSIFAERFGWALSILKSAKEAHFDSVTGEIELPENLSREDLEQALLAAGCGMPFLPTDADLEYATYQLPLVAGMLSYADVLEC